jgi:hypothetical protein
LEAQDYFVCSWRSRIRRKSCGFAALHLHAA